VSAGWNLAVDGDALRFLLSAKARQRQTVLDAFDHLVREPHQPADYVEPLAESAGLQREGPGALCGDVLAGAGKDCAGGAHYPGYE